MPHLPVPDRFEDILDSTALAHLATIGPDGHPQVNPIWFLRDGDRIVFSVKHDTQKLQNIQRDRHVALSLLDLQNPGHYLELRGVVEEIELYEDLRFVDLLALKYTGKDFHDQTLGVKRYRIVFAPQRWTGQ